MLHIDCFFTYHFTFLFLYSSKLGLKKKNLAVLKKNYLIKITWFSIHKFLIMKFNFSIMSENILSHLFKNKLDILFARAIYASDTALSHFENKYWKDLFSHLR